MRRHLGAPFALVLVNDARRVDRNTSIRVDDHAKQTRVRLQIVSSITFNQWLKYSDRGAGSIN